MAVTFPNLVLPTCGLGWNFARRPKFNTIHQQPLSNRHPASATLQQSTIFDIEISYNGLLNNPGSSSSYSDDVAYLQEFYEACRGPYGYFTFDPSVNHFANMSTAATMTSLANGYFGVGNGTQTVFPLWRSTNALGWTTPTMLEMIQNVTSLSAVYANGAVVASTGYTWSNFPATVTFSTAPANGAALTWAGNYSYLCHFAEASLDFNELMYQLWELKSLKLETINL